MRFCLIHGAGASPLSWRTFESLIDHPVEKATYDVHFSFEQILDQCRAKARSADVVVGHSFGGLVAWHLAQEEPRLRGGVSVASPWGGSALADWADLLTGGMTISSFFKNVGRARPHLVTARSTASRVPWLNVVATRGLFPDPPNDGVLTVESQESLCLTNCSLIRVHQSHAEVLHSDELVRVVHRFVQSRLT